MLLDLAFDVRIVFIVDARDLLVAIGDDSDFFHRRTSRIVDQAFRIDAGGGELAAQTGGGRIGADEADKRDLGAQRSQVVRNVRGAAEADVFGLKLNDGHRRFRRNARHLADDETIEHHVACHQNGQPRQARNQIAGAPGVERRQRHGSASAGERAAANGSVTSISSSMRNSESPKLYSNMPAASMAIMAASAAAASIRCWPL